LRLRLTGPCKWLVVGLLEKTMRAAPYRRLRASLSIAASAALAGTILFGAGSAFAGQTTKVAVCHFDKTANAWVEISVSTKGGAVHLAKGDFLASAALNGKAPYAMAWTEMDGVAGFSACGDMLIAAVVENSGDTAMGAGDAVIYGKYPNAFAAPYGFAAFTTTSRPILGVQLCDINGVAVDLGDNASALILSTPNFQAFADGSGFFLSGGEPAVVTTFIRDVVVWDSTAAGFSDLVLVDPPGVSLSAGSVQDDPFINVTLPAC